MGSNLELRDPPTRSRLPLCIYEINYGAARVPATARPNTAVPSGGAVLRSHRHAHGQEGSLVEAAHQEHGEVYSRVPAGGRQTIVAPPHTAVRWHGRARQHGGCQRVEPVPTEQPYSQSTQGRGRVAGRPERAPLCTTGREGGGCPTCRVTPAPPHPLHPPPTRSRRLSPRSLHPSGRAPESGVPAPTAVFSPPQTDCGVKSRRRARAPFRALRRALFALAPARRPLERPRGPGAGLWGRAPNGWNETSRGNDSRGAEGPIAAARPRRAQRMLTMDGHALLAGVPARVILWASRPKPPLCTEQSLHHVRTEERVPRFGRAGGYHASRVAAAKWAPLRRPHRCGSSSPPPVYFWPRPRRAMPVP